MGSSGPRVFTQNGLPLTDEYAKIITILGFEAGAHYVRTELGLDMDESKIVDKWNEMARESYEHTVELKPGVAQYLNWLHDSGIALGIATSNKRMLAEPAPINNDIYDLFSAIVYTEDVGAPKTKPDVYLHAAQLLKSSASRSVVFEDTVTAIKTAGNAGFRTVGVFDNHQQQDTALLQHHCDLFVRRFSEVLPGATLHDTVLA
jgi:HAD superfamily hydrolase (TIGR01509 family)